MSNCFSSETSTRPHAASSSAAHRTGIGWEERTMEFGDLRLRYSDKTQVLASLGFHLGFL
jgi:hypothetical protein